jgi:putative hemolysin
MTKQSMTEDAEISHKRNLIDVDDVLRKKSGRLYSFIPRFLINYLKRIIHQDTINEVLTRYEDRYDFDFLESVLNEYFTVEITARNLENIPLTGKYTLVSNHPLGGLDGMALMHVVGKRRKDLKFIANDILLELQNLKNLFVPVNKHARNTAEGIRIIENVYESDNLVLVFPAGLVSRKHTSGEIKDLEWKKSFLSRSIKHKRDIIPVYINGKNSKFFYNMAMWRKRLRIQGNLEMLFLVDEMFMQSEKKLTLTFGKPIPYTTFTKAKTHTQWVEWVRTKVYEMGEEPKI